MTYSAVARWDGMHAIAGAFCGWLAWFGIARLPYVNCFDDTNPGYRRWFCSGSTIITRLLQRGGAVLCCDDGGVIPANGERRAGVSHH